jgi:hypothetical protein
MVERLSLSHFIHADNLRAGSDWTCVSCWHVRTRMGGGTLRLCLDRKHHLGPAFVHTNKKKRKNHSTQDSHVVPHRGTNWAALWLTAQIKRDAVLSESYGRG